MERVTGAVTETSEGFADLVQTFRPRLVRRLALIVRDVAEAEDICQHAIVRTLQSGPTTGATDIERWLTVVAVRLAIDERRRRRRWGFLPIRETDQEWAMTTDPDLWQALSELDRRSRAALVMTVLDGYSQQEVAEALGVPRGTVASWLSRGKERLRERLSDK